MAADRDPTELMQRRVRELVSCPICMEDVQNGKMLPCLHTFCLQCIKDYWKDKVAKESVPCPVCRQPFTIPSGGLKSLKNNFLVENLLEINKEGKSDSS